MENAFFGDEPQIFIYTKPKSAIDSTDWRVLVNETGYFDGKKTTEYCLPCGSFSLHAGTMSTFGSINHGPGGRVRLMLTAKSDVILAEANGNQADGTYPPTKFVVDCKDQGVTVSNTLFHRNAAAQGGALGMPQHRKNSLFKISSSAFSNNTASAGKGGAVYISGINSALHVTSGKPSFQRPKTLSREASCSFSDNLATLGGGALAIEDGGGLRIDNAAAVGNAANGPGSLGGFLFARNSGRMLLQNVHIDASFAQTGGGGIAIRGSRIALEAVNISSCSAGGQGGGGLYLDEGSEAHLIGGCRLLDNAAVKGGAGGHARVSSSKLIVHGETSQLTWPASKPIFPDPVRLGHVRHVKIINGRCEDIHGFVSATSRKDCEKGVSEVAYQTKTVPDSRFRAWLPRECGVDGWDELRFNLPHDRQNAGIDGLKTCSETFWCVCRRHFLEPRPNIFYRGKSAGASGGGFFCTASQSPLDMNAEISTENVLSCSGQTYEYMRNVSSDLKWKDVCFEKGINLGAGSAIHESKARFGGGAILANLCDVRLVKTTLANNTADGANGGGILLQAAARLALIDASSMISNKAIGGAGGALACESCGQVMHQGGGLILEKNIAGRPQPNCPQPVNSFFVNNELEDRGPPCICETESFANKVGSSMSCTKCPRRSSSPAGSISPQACACDSDTYAMTQKDGSLLECLKCPVKSTLVQNVGPVSAACACDEGYGNSYSDDADDTIMTCVKCGGRMFSPAGSNVCRCRAGDYYQNGLQNDNCAPCPKGADCSAKDGASVLELTVQAGFWRPNHQSMDFLDCRDGYIGVTREQETEFALSRCCPLNASSGASICAKLHNDSYDMEQQCAPKYRGPLCAGCAIDHVRMSHDCIPCVGGASLSAALWTLAVICLAFSLVLCFVQLFSARKKKTQDISEAETLDKFSESSVVGQVKLLILFAQLLSSMPNAFSNVPWPESFKIFALNISLPFTLDFLSAFSIGGCRMSLFPLDAFVLHMITPLFLTVAIVTAWLAASKFTPICCLRGVNNREKRAHLLEQARRQFVIRIFIFMIQLLWPGLGARIFNLFRCKEFLGVAKPVLEANVLVTCHTGQHAVYEIVSIFFMVFYVVGVPLGVFVVLWHNRAHLNDTSSGEHIAVWYKYHALYGQFEPKYWYFGTVAFFFLFQPDFRIPYYLCHFSNRALLHLRHPPVFILKIELIIMLNKCTLTGVLSIVQQDSPGQLLLAVTIMQIFTLVTLKLAPYVKDTDDFMSFIVSLAIMIDYGAGFILLLDKKESFFASLTIEIILMILNIGVLIMLVFNIIVIKWNLLDCNTAKRPPFCRGRGCDDNKNQKTNAAAIVPIDASAELAETSDDSLLLRNDDHNDENEDKDEDEDQGELVEKFSLDEDDGNDFGGVGDFCSGDSRISVHRIGEPRRLRRLSTNSTQMLHRVQTQYEQGQRALHRRLGQRQLQAKRKTQIRLAARRKLKHSKVLRKVAAFKGLGVASLDGIIESMTILVAKQGQAIVQEGEPADRFFVCMSGQCSAWKKIDHGASKEMKLGTIQALEFFGESMMMGDATVRSATVRAGGEGIVSLMVLSRREWEIFLNRGGEEVSEVLAQLNQVRKARRERNAQALAAGAVPNDEN